MPKDRKRSWPMLAAAATLVLVFAATWLVLDGSERRPRWLVVEAPRAAFVGRPVEIRVTLKEPIGPAQIVCTLHRAGSDRRLQERIASSGPAREAAGGGTQVFRFDLPETESLVFVSAIIYLSPTGSWRDRTRAAHTKLLPIRRGSPAADLQVLQRTRVYHSTTAAEDAAARTAAEAASREPRREPSSWDHPILFIILFATAILCRVKAGGKRRDPSPAERAERTIWLAFSGILVLGAFLELSGVVGDLAAWGRRLAQDRNLYEVRGTFQKAIIAAVAAAGFGLSILFIKAMRKPGSHRYLWGVGIGLAAYLSVSFVSVLSFHAVDVVRAMTWRGISPIDAARGAGALVSLVAAAFAFGAKHGKVSG